MDLAAAAQFNDFFADLARAVADDPARQHYLDTSFFKRFETGSRMLCDAEDAEPVGGGVGEVVGWGVGEGVGFEAEGAADAAGAAVAGGEDVDVGVADHDGFGGGDGAAGDACWLRR